MIDLHLSAFAPRWRFLYVVRIDAYEFLPNRRKKAGNLFRFPVRCAAVLATVISLRLGSDRNVHSVAV